MRIELKVNGRVWFVEFGEKGREQEHRYVAPVVDEYEVFLTGVKGTSKIPLIRELRLKYDLTLRAAKDIVDGLSIRPYSLGRYSREDAERIVDKIKLYGEIRIA